MRQNHSEDSQDTAQHSDPVVRSVFNSLERARIRLLKKERDSLRCFVSISGGEDSHVLLHVLYSSRDALRLEIALLHVNDGTADAEAHESFVRGLADRYELPLVVDRRGVKQPASPSESPGTASCDALSRAENSPSGAFTKERFALYQRVRNSYGADLILFGTHLYDRLELLLFELLPGQSDSRQFPLDELDFKHGLLFPFLNLERTALEDYSIAHNLAFVTAAECLASSPRTLFRRQLLPLLTAEWDESAAHNLAVTERTLAREGARGMTSLLPAVRKGNQRRHSFEERLLEIPGILISRYDDGTLAAVEARRITPNSVMPNRYGQELAGNPRSIARAYFDLSTLPEQELRVREFREGDYVLTEAQQAVLLEKLYEQAGLQRHEFTRLPLVVSGGVILWAPGVFRLSCSEPTEATSAVIELSFRRREPRARPVTLEVPAAAFAHPR